MPPIEQTDPYIPKSDLGFKVWLENFAEQLEIDPSRFGVTDADAALIMSSYNAYASALDAALKPATRNATTVGAKDSQKASADATARPLAQIIKANQGVDNESKLLLGLHIDDTPSPIPAPATAPMLNIKSAFSGQHELRYADELTPTSRSKPKGVTQLELWVYVGASATANPEDASYVGVYTKNPIMYTFSPEDAGSIATYFARWHTQRGLTGPWSLPVAMGISFGGPVETQATGTLPDGGTPLTQDGEDDLRIAA